MIKVFIIYIYDIQKYKYFIITNIDAHRDR